MSPDYIYCLSTASKCNLAVLPETSLDTSGDPTYPNPVLHSLPETPKRLKTL